MPESKDNLASIAALRELAVCLVGEAARDVLTPDF